MRRARLITAHPALAAASSADRDALRIALSSLFLRTKASRDALDADLAAGVVMAVLEAAVMEWLRRKQKSPLKTALGLAFGRLSRLAAGPAR